MTDLSPTGSQLRLVPTSRNKSGYLLFGDPIFTYRGIPLTAEKLSFLSYYIDTYRIRFADLQYHAQRFQQEANLFSDRISQLLAKISLTTDLGQRLRKADEILVSELARIEEEVLAVHRYCESQYYQVLNLLDKKAVMTARNKLVTEYFNALSVKLVQYTNDLNSLLRDYAKTNQQLTDFSIRRATFKHKTEEIDSKILVLANGLQNLKLRGKRIEFELARHSKRVNELRLVVTANRSFYCGANEDQTKLVDDFQSLTNALNKIEGQISLISAKLEEINCNYNRFLNLDQLNSVENAPYLDMEEAIKKLISGFLIIAGDNTIVEKDANGIYTIIVKWPEYPEREKYDVKLPKPQVIKYEMPSNSCPVTCGSCSGMCPTVDCQSTTCGSCNTGPTSTPTPTPPPSVDCQYVLTDYRAADPTFTPGCDFDCYVDGIKIGTFPASKTDPPTSLTVTRPAGSGGTLIEFRAVKGSCKNIIDVEVTKNGTTLSGGCGTFAVAVDTNHTEPYSYKVPGCFSCTVEKKRCKVKIKDLNANRIIDDDLDLYVNGVFAKSFPGSTDPTTEYEIETEDGNVEFIFKYMKYNGYGTKKEIEIYDDSGAKIYTGVIAFNPLNPKLAYGDTVATFNVPVTCKKSSTDSLKLIPVTGDLRAELEIPPIYQASLVPEFSASVLRIHLSLQFDYPANHAFFNLHIGALGPGSRLVAFTEQGIVTDGTWPVYRRADSTFMPEILIPLPTDFYRRYKDSQLVVAVSDDSRCQDMGLDSLVEAYKSNRIYSFDIDFCSKLNTVPPLSIKPVFSERQIQFQVPDLNLAFYLLGSKTGSLTDLLLNPATGRFEPMPTSSPGLSEATSRANDGTVSFSLSETYDEFSGFELAWVDPTTPDLLRYRQCGAPSYPFASSPDSLDSFYRKMANDYAIFSLSLRLDRFQINPSSGDVEVTYTVEDKELGLSVDLYLFTEIDQDLTWYDPEGKRFARELPVVVRTHVLEKDRVLSIPSLILDQALSLSPPNLWLGYGNSEANQHASSALDLKYATRSHALNLTNYRISPVSVCNLAQLQVTELADGFIYFRASFSSEGPRYVSLYYVFLFHNQHYVWSNNQLQAIPSWPLALDPTLVGERLAFRQELVFNLSLQHEALRDQLRQNIGRLFVAFRFDDEEFSDLLSVGRYAPAPLFLTKCSEFSPLARGVQVSDENVFMWIELDKVQLSLLEEQQFYLFVVTDSTRFPLMGSLETTDLISLPALSKTSFEGKIYTSTLAEISDQSQLACLDQPYSVRIDALAARPTVFSFTYDLRNSLFETEILPVGQHRGNQDFWFRYLPMTDRVGSTIDFEVSLNPALAGKTVLLWPALVSDSLYFFTADSASAYSLDFAGQTFPISLVKYARETDAEPISFQVTTSQVTTSPFRLRIDFDPHLWSGLLADTVQFTFLLSDSDIHEAVFRRRSLDGPRLDLLPLNAVDLTDSLVLFSDRSVKTLYQSDEVANRQRSLAYFNYWSHNLAEVSPFSALPLWFMTKARPVLLEQESVLKWELKPYGQLYLAGIADLASAVSVSMEQLNFDQNLVAVAHDDRLYLELRACARQRIRLLIDEVEYSTVTNYFGLAYFEIERPPNKLDVEIRYLQAKAVFSFPSNQLVFPDAPDLLQTLHQSLNQERFIQSVKERSTVQHHLNPGITDFVFTADYPCIVTVADEQTMLLSASPSTSIHCSLAVFGTLTVTIQPFSVRTAESGQSHYTYYFTESRPVHSYHPVTLSQESLQPDLRLGFPDTPYFIHAQGLYAQDLSLAGDSDEVCLVIDGLEYWRDFSEGKVHDFGPYQQPVSISVLLPDSVSALQLRLKEVSNLGDLNE